MNQHIHTHTQFPEYFSSKTKVLRSIKAARISNYDDTTNFQNMYIAVISLREKRERERKRREINLGQFE